MKLPLTVTLSCLVVLLSTAVVPTGSADNPPEIDQLSLASLLLTPFSNSGRSWSATGFVVDHEGQHFLVTNWHVVTGRHPLTDSLKSGISPDSLMFKLPRMANGQIIWINQRVSLYCDNRKPRWIEHPLGKRVDVVALPLVDLDTNLTIVPVDLNGGPSNLRLRVTQSVSIIGFPQGLTGGAILPIWKTGQIASEPELDYSSLPLIVVDARTIGGMSGLPVVCRSYGSYSDESYSLALLGGAITKFVGVYSGRFQVDVIDKTTKSDLGLVWKPETIKAILQTIPKNATICD